MNEKIIHIENLVVGYGNRLILKDLNLNLAAGSLTALLGPNGAGKSTLIKSISGIIQPLQGSVNIRGKALSNFQQKELAKELSLVLTDNQAPGNLTVYALVALGRFPYTSWLGRLSLKDQDIIRWALESTDMLDFANRHLGELSDGERQKVMIARALAQETDIIILDEPTAHLDTPNRLEIFHLLRELANTSGRAILVSTHDIDTALHYSDQLWLLNEQTIVSGLPEDLVIKGALEKAFIKKDLVFDYSTGKFKKSPRENARGIGLKGQGELVFWLTCALERNGFRIDSQSDHFIEIIGDLEKPLFKMGGRNDTYKTIEQLLIQLKNGED